MINYREIADFPGYRCGNDGSIWSRRIRGPGDHLSDKWHQLGPNVDRDGYLRVSLYYNKRLHKYKVHRLICEAFHGPCPEGLECRHLNGDRTDNLAENLVWGTPAENQADRVRNGTMNPLRGEKHHATKLTENDVRAIRKTYATGNVNQRQLAKLYGMSRWQIGRIVRGQDWQHVL